MWMPRGHCAHEQWNKYCTQSPTPPKLTSTNKHVTANNMTLGHYYTVTYHVDKPFTIKCGCLFAKETTKHIKHDGYCLSTSSSRQTITGCNVIYNIEGQFTIQFRCIFAQKTTMVVTYLDIRAVVEC